jgi:hypothetical protein
MKQTLLTILALAVCLVAPPLMKADTSVFVGTWKLNLEKSKYPPKMAPKSLTRTIRAGSTFLSFNMCVM